MKELDHVFVAFNFSSYLFLRRYSTYFLFVNTYYCYCLSYLFSTSDFFRGANFGGATSPYSTAFAAHPESFGCSTGLDSVFFPSQPSYFF